MVTEQDEKRIDVLDAEQCWALIGGQEVGRLGVVVDGYPVVVPVNFAVDGGGGVIVLRMGGGAVSQAADHANVTFQADALDPAGRTGWSVLVRGLVEEVGPEHRDDLVARTRASRASPWAPGERGHLKRLIPHGVSGRRITQDRLPDAWEPDWFHG